jgi:hypothetical protein
MATILTWVREPTTSVRFTIVRYDEFTLRMTVKDNVTRTQYEVLFDSNEELSKFINAPDSKRAELVKTFRD